MRYFAYEENYYYQKFLKQKHKLREKYKDIDFSGVGRPGPTVTLNYTDKERQRYRKYLKEMGDLLFKPKGWYQKFLWDALSEHDKEIMERKARGRKYYDIF